MVQEFNGKKEARGISDLRFQRRIGRCGSRRGSRDSSLTLRMTVSSRATDPHPGPLPGRERGIFVEARAPGTGSPWQSSPALRAEKRKEEDQWVPSLPGTGSPWQSSPALRANSAILARRPANWPSTARRAHESCQGLQVPGSGLLSPFFPPGGRTILIEKPRPDQTRRHGAAAIPRTPS